MMYTKREVLRFASVIEAVRHRGLMLRKDAAQAEKPKVVSWQGKDWEACGVCIKDAEMILEAMGHVQLRLVPVAGGE